jgi:hypothetical protein
MTAFWDTVPTGVFERLLLLFKEFLQEVDGAIRFLLKHQVAVIIGGASTTWAGATDVDKFDCKSLEVRGCDLVVLLDHPRYAWKLAE